MNILIKSSFILLLTIFSFNSFSFCDDVGELYNKILKVSNEIFNHKKLDLTFESSIGMRDISEISGSNAGTYGSVKVVVPLKSKTERIQIESSKTDYLEKASNLVKQVKINRRKIGALNKKIQDLKPALNDLGLNIINEFYKTQEDIILLEEEIESNIRILNVMAKFNSAEK